jgi:hypothetical protein
MVRTIILACALFTSSPAKPTTTQSCPKWEPLIAEYGLPVEWASRTMWRESRCAERVVSKPNGDGTTDIGLMQVNSSWRSVTRAVCKTNDHRQALRKARCNLAVAKYLYANGGKHHWRGSSGN